MTESGKSKLATQAPTTTVCCLFFPQRLPLQSSQPHWCFRPSQQQSQEHLESNWPGPPFSPALAMGSHWQSCSRSLWQQPLPSACSSSALPLWLSGPSVLCSASSPLACQAWGHIAQRGICEDGGPWLCTLDIPPPPRSGTHTEQGQLGSMLPSRDPILLRCRPSRASAPNLKTPQILLQGGGMPSTPEPAFSLCRSCAPKHLDAFILSLLSPSMCRWTHMAVHAHKHTDTCMPTYTFSPMIIQR